jgi:hypothetical protein
MSSTSPAGSPHPVQPCLIGHVRDGLDDAASRAAMLSSLIVACSVTVMPEIEPVEQHRRAPRLQRPRWQQIVPPHTR